MTLDLDGDGKTSKFEALIDKFTGDTFALDLCLGLLVAGMLVGTISYACDIATTRSELVASILLLTGAEVGLAVISGFVISHRIGQTLLIVAFVGLTCVSVIQGLSYWFAMSAKKEIAENAPLKEKQEQFADTILVDLARNQDFMTAGEKTAARNRVAPIIGIQKIDSQGITVVKKEVNPSTAFYDYLAGSDADLSHLLAVLARGLMFVTFILTIMSFSYLKQVQLSRKY
jgi:hypothetical protein